LGELERIADEVRQVLDFALLVVMSEDDGVPLLFQSGNLLSEVE
jgi:hypothetical protein